MTQAVGERILAAAGGQLVHERLDREHVGERAQGTQRGHPHRRLGHEAGGDVDRGDVVERFGVALRSGGKAVAVARWRRGERGGAVPGGQQRRLPRRPARPGAVRVAAYLVPPAQDGAGGVQLGAAGHDHRGPERLPAILVLTGPPDQHRALRHGQGEQGGVQRHVVGAVMPVASGPVDVDHPDVLRRPPQRLGQGGAQFVRSLGVRPDGQAPAAVEARGGGGRPERSVHQERARVGCRDGGGVRIRRRAAAQNRIGLRPCLAQRRAPIGGQAEPRRRGASPALGLPLPAGARRQHVVGGGSLLLALRRHPHEAAVHHHRQHPAHGARRIRRQPGEPLPVTGRAQHPAVHHARQPQVMYEVAVAAHHPVHPPPRALPSRGERPVRGRLRCGVPVIRCRASRGRCSGLAAAGTAVAKFVRLQEIPIVDRGASRRWRAGLRDAAAGAGRRTLRHAGALAVRRSWRCACVRAWPNRSRAWLEPVLGNFEALGGAAHQLVARRAGGGADRGSGALHRTAAGGQAVVGRDAGVAAAHADAVRRQGQLLAADQGQRIAQPLAQLHLAGQHGDGAVPFKPQPVRYTPGHGAGSPAAAAAAACVARIMRLWAPQRQMLRSRAAWICFRVGAGSRSSRAAAAIITPPAQ